MFYIICSRESFEHLKIQNAVPPLLRGFRSFILISGNRHFVEFHMLWKLQYFNLNLEIKSDDKILEQDTGQRGFNGSSCSTA